MAPSSGCLFVLLGTQFGSNAEHLRSVVIGLAPSSSSSGGGAMEEVFSMPPLPEGDGGAPTPAGPVGCGGGGAETEAGAPSEGGASCRKGHPPPVTSGGIVVIGSGAPVPKLAARPARPLASDTRSCERISGACATMGEHWQARGVKGAPAARAIQRVGAERGCRRLGGGGGQKRHR
jgi:hypothetical protein